MNKKTNFLRKAQGQGTIEYLIIIAIVIVIGLVVVGLLSGFLSTSSGTSQSLSRAGSWTNSIALTESSVNPDGNYLVRLVNNTGQELTVSNVMVGDSNVDFSSDLFQGDAKNFVVDSGDVCSTGSSTTKTVIVTYYSRHGIQKKEIFPTDVYFDCEDYSVSLLENRCPSTSCSYDGNVTASQMLSGYSGYGASSTLLYGSVATQYLSADTNIVTAGYYDANNLSLIDTDLNSDSILSGVTIFGVEGSASGSATLVWSDYNSTTDNWFNHVNNCAMMNSVDYGDPAYEGWRLPTVDEMAASDYYGETGERLWTGSTDPSNTAYAYFLSDVDGSINGATASPAYKTFDYLTGARCVRSE